MFLFVLGDNQKYKGKMEIMQCSARRFFTFFDLILSHKLNIVPVIGVDFSLANLTFDENQYCLHTLKQGAPNDYVTALKCVADAYKAYSKFNLAYGFGARTYMRNKND